MLSLGPGGACSGEEGVRRAPGGLGQDGCREVPRPRGCDLALTGGDTAAASPRGACGPTPPACSEDPRCCAGRVG